MHKCAAGICWCGPPAVLLRQYSPLPCFFASLKKWSCRVFLVHAATTGWALQAMGLLIMPAMLLLLLDAECAAA
jgi:hypothetical protein